MKLYLLEPDESSGPTYGIYVGFVVRAETRQQARQLCNEAGQGMWNEGECTCLASNVNGKPEIILEAFRDE